MSLLTIIQAVAVEVGLTKPQVVIGSQDALTNQMLALCTRGCKEIAADLWQQMSQTAQINTNFVPSQAFVANGTNVITVTSVTGILPNMVAIGTDIPSNTRVVSTDGALNSVTLTAPVAVTGVQNVTFSQDAYVLPSDFKFLVNRTAWDNTSRWEIVGPSSAQEWRYLRSGLTQPTVNRRFRFIDNLFYIDPPPTDTATLSFEYVSKNWCQSASGVPQSEWAADSDIPLIDEDLIVLSTIYRFKSAKGLDYVEDFNQFNVSKSRIMGHNKGARTLEMANGGYGLWMPGCANIPSSNYGLKN